MRFSEDVLTVRRSAWIGRMRLSEVMRTVRLSA